MRTPSNLTSLHTMPISLDYGDATSLSFTPPASCRVEFLDLPASAATSSLSEQVRAALEAPLEYPPLRMSVVPGDHVALVIEPGLDAAPTIVAEIVAALAQGGVAAADVVVVRSQLDDTAQLADPRANLPIEIRAAVQLETHDPGNRQQVEYLGATHKGRSLYLNRVICDADVVVTVGMLRGESALNYYGVHSAVYPTFSDEATLKRFCNPGLLDRAGGLKRRAMVEVNGAGWLCGATFTVQLVPGALDETLGVFCGEPRAVYKAGRARYDSIWQTSVAAPATMVVAAVDGQPSQMTWENAARALIAADRLVDEGGMIVLLDTIVDPLGRALATVDVDDDDAVTYRKIVEQRPIDTLLAIELARIVRRSRVYVNAPLDPATLEKLSLIPLSNGQELERLLSGHAACIVLPHAQFADVRLLEEG